MERTTLELFLNGEITRQQRRRQADCRRGSCANARFIKELGHVDLTVSAEVCRSLVFSGLVVKGFAQYPAGLSPA